MDSGRCTARKNVIVPMVAAFVTMPPDCRMARPARVPAESRPVLAHG
jgi:hypothetical protein